MMKDVIKKALRRLGYQVSRVTSKDSAPVLHGLADLSDSERAIVFAAQPFTQTGDARLATMVEAVKYIVKNRIPGDLAECGVWRGGSMMVAAKTLLALGDVSRRLFLYDTFEGMSEPSNKDLDFEGNAAAALLRAEIPGEGVWARASLEDVQQNLRSTGYPEDKITYVRGKVEETIPGTLPERLALLRLDTDWYESTTHELQHLYPILSRLGLLIIDDYGHWQGARRAVDEFIATLSQPLYLHRIDYTGRVATKI
jgi:O-methyltransferase